MKIIFIWVSLLFSSGLLLAQDNEFNGSLNSTTKSDSLITLPYKTIEKELSVGSSFVINPDELMSFDNIQSASSTLEGRVPGMRELGIHGFGEALVIIDGVPRPLTSVNLQEIEQITVLKDANSAVFYGSQALNGVILITTKRGKITEPKVNVWAETGFNNPISYPKYLNSADYMELYNEARVNDELSELYPVSDINATRNGLDPLRFPDVDYLNPTFLNNLKPSSRVVADFNGGNENAQYYINAEYLHTGSILKVGEGKNQQRNRLNLRSNINFKINDFIKSYLDIAAIYDNEKSPNGNFWNNATTLRPNLFPLLIDTTIVNYSGAHVLDGGYLLGGTSQYTNNVYGDLVLGGYTNTMNTTAHFNYGIDMNLGRILNGLTFKAQASFDFYKRFAESLNNTYAVYELSSWNDNNVPTITKIGSDKFSGTQGVGNTNIRRVFSFYSVLNYLRHFDSKNTLSISIMPSINRIRQTSSSLIDDKYTHIGANANYVYDRKYIIDFSSSTDYSVILPEGNRIGFSPTASLGWIISNEDFMQTSDFIDFLKLKGSVGFINSDINFSGYHLYQDFFATSGSYAWNDGVRSNSRTIFQSVGNNKLFFEKRRDLNIGIEANLLNKSLWLDVNLFRKQYADKVTQQNANYLEYLGGFVPYTNYGIDQYAGIDFNTVWSKTSGDFKIDVGLNGAFLKTKVKKTDEIWEFDYQYRTGKPVNAIFGLEASGLFKDQNEIDNHSTQMYGIVAPGDIKYVDQNNDKIIDDNDIIMLGSSTPDFYGGLNLKLAYKNFTLFGIASTMQGVERTFSNSYYWVYGDRKYSEEVLNRWTQSTASTATYPRLTTINTSNNFRTSSFWLYDNSRVSIDRVQLTYDIPKTINSLHINKLSFYVRGSNLSTISKNSKRMELNVGSEPQYRFYSIGVKAIFF